MLWLLSDSVHLRACPPKPALDCGYGNGYSMALCYPVRGCGSIALPFANTVLVITRCYGSVLTRFLYSVRVFHSLNHFSAFFEACGGLSHWTADFLIILVIGTYLPSSLTKYLDTNMMLAISRRCSQSLATCLRRIFNFSALFLPNLHCALLRANRHKWRHLIAPPPYSRQWSHMMPKCYRGNEYSHAQPTTCTECKG